MQTLFAWIFVPAALFAGYPWAVWLTTRSPQAQPPSLWLTLSLGFALGVGTLTLVMFWELLLGLSLNFGWITSIYALLMLPGWVLWLRAKKGLRAKDLGLNENKKVRRPRFSVLSIAGLRWLLLLGIAGAIVFNAAYWPFPRWSDARGIYNKQAVRFMQSGALLPLSGPDTDYHGYPPLMPLAYAYTYLASGWQNEYLARLIAALLAVGCLPAAYALGSLLDDDLGGWLSLFVLGLAPTYGKWASTGYVDLPSAFFYTLSAIFAYRLWRAPHWSDALLAGMLIGLAAWTKNATLIGVGALGVWLLWGIVRKRISLRLALVSLAACAVIAGPWYARNVLIGGFLIPPTAWTDQAQRTIQSLLVFATSWGLYGPSGWAITLGVVVLVVRAFRRQQVSEAVLLLLWTVPFFAAWWFLTSYDPRLLLPALPVFAIIGGIELAWLWRRLPHLWTARLLLPASLLALALTVQVMWFSVEFKDEILRDPLMGHDAKEAIVVGDR